MPVASQIAEPTGLPRSQPTRTGLVTPPPTFPAPRRSTIPDTTTPSPGKLLAGLPPLGDLTIDLPQSSNRRQPRSRFLTPIYNHLVSTRMVGYFKVEDGVSYLSAQGTHRFYFYNCSIADPNCRGRCEVGSDRKGTGVVGRTL